MTRNRESRKWPMLPVVSLLALVSLILANSQYLRGLFAIRAVVGTYGTGLQAASFPRATRVRPVPSEFAM